jgi:hypothetical protein
LLIGGSPFQGRCPASEVNDGGCPEKPDHLIPSDWRTFELCEFHSLPMLNIEALQNTERLPKIQIFDFNAMNKAKEAAISNFGKFLKRNRLSMAPLYYIKKTLPNGPLVK